MIHFLGLSPSLDVTYTVHHLAIGGIHRPQQVVRLPGGKSLNAARATAVLGRPAHAIAPLGGHVGALIAELLGETGVGFTAIPTRTESRLCVSIADGIRSVLTEFYEQAAELEHEAWTGVARAVDAIESGWLVVSGSVPNGVPLDELAALLARVAGRGIPVAVDVHGDALAAIVDGARPELVKVNRAEACDLLGAHGTSSLETLATGIRERGAGTAVITDGIDGSLGIDGTGAIWRVHSDAPPGAFPVGSGDSFLAGLVDALESSRPLVEALARGSACGAANAGTPGAARFDTADLEWHLERTTVAQRALPRRR